MASLLRDAVKALTSWDAPAAWHNAFFALLLAAEAVLSSLIVLRVPYTEIDWMAYMQEVQGWVDGDTDYKNLRGDTGPLVYPGGFMYVYRFLRELTGTHVVSRTDAVTADGLPVLPTLATDVRTAQWVFVGVYVLFLAVVLKIYQRARLAPPWTVILLLLSKRIHSLFVLRLFNDCIAMLALYVCVLAAAHRQFLLSCVAFSLSVSVKMNALLAAPGIAWILARNVALPKVVLYALVVLAIQVALGWPFLSTHPSSYVSRAFELSRVFMHRWTVNLAWMPEHVFVAKTTAAVLLAGHLLALVALLFTRWSAVPHGVVGSLTRVLSRATSLTPAYKDTPAYIVFVLLSSNFAGIVFARTLHYQFYTWYFHALPLLLSCTHMPVPMRIAVMAAIEYAFNVGDANGAGTPFSSAVLTAAHVVTLLALLLSRWPRWQLELLADRAHKE